MSRTVAVAWMLVAIGCSVDRGLESSGLALEDAPDAFATEYCERRADCCSPFDVPSVAMCALTTEQSMTTMLALADANDLTYDPSCWGATMELLREDDCEAQLQPALDECRPRCSPWHGDQQVGEYCTVYELNVTDCAPGLVCVLPYCESGDCKEVCRDPCARAELGERCLNVPCDDGMLCAVLDDECVPTPAIGEPCVWGSGCGDGAMCDDASDTCIEGVEPGELGAPGTPCNSWMQCESGSCPAGFCADHPDPPDLGEPCTDSCTDGLECSATTSTCEEPGRSICTADPL
jgi:hypothetical protein